MKKHINFHLSSLFSALVILACGCDRIENPAATSAPPPADLEATAIAIFDAKSTLHDPYGDFIGCGVLASSWQNDKRRYFVLTAAHMQPGLRSGLQLGLRETGSMDCIKRLQVPAGGIDWKAPDSGHDLVIGDITADIVPMSAQSVDAAFIDLDSLGFGSLVEDFRIVDDVGVASKAGYERLGIGPFAHATVVCAKADKIALKNPLAYEWSSPFVRKEGTLIETFVEKLFARTDANGNEISEARTHIVNAYLGKIAKGDSGAPVFVQGMDKREYFTGIVIGRINDEFYAVPVDIVRDYVHRCYGGAEHTHSDNLYESVHAAEYEAREYAGRDTPVAIWKPGVRRVDLTLEGDCTAGNSFMVYLDTMDNRAALDDLGEMSFSIGWDNRDTQQAMPGHKSVTMTFYFDESGRAIHGDAEDHEKVAVLHHSYDLNKNLNLMRIVSGGRGDTNGRVRIELFALRDMKEGK